MKSSIPTLILIVITTTTLAEGQLFIEDTKILQDQSQDTLRESYRNSAFSVSENDSSNNISFWRVAAADSKYDCILLQGELNVTIFLEQDDSRLINLTVPKEAKANGICATLWDDFQTITLSWNDTLESNETRKTTNYLTLVFASDWTSEFTDDFSLSKDKYALNTIEIRVTNSENSKNETLIFVTASDIIEFTTPKNHSNMCKPNQILDYKNIQLRVANFQVEAFRDSSLGPNNLFSSPVDCSIDDIEKNWNLKIIMIIVWSTIACFLVALLVVFLVFRKKCASVNDSEYQILE